MPYKFVGRLIGLLCEDCSEPLVGATVRLVRSTQVTITRDAAADPKTTTTMHDEPAAAARADDVLGEAMIGAEGAFQIELVEGYDGEAFDVDIFCGTMTGHKV